MQVLTDEFKFKLLQHESGSFLTDTIPDDWHGMSDEKQDEFLTDHAWEPLEYHEAPYIRDLINCAQSSTIMFLKENNLVKEPEPCQPTQ